MALSGTIHLWASDGDARKYQLRTKCGIALTSKSNVLYASTAAQLKIPPARVCRTCYRLSEPWLGEVR